MKRRLGEVTAVGFGKRKNFVQRGKGVHDLAAKLETQGMNLAQLI